MASGRFANHLLLACLSCQLPLTLLAAVVIWLFCWAGCSNLGAGSLIRFQPLNSLVHLPWTTFKLNCFCVLYFFSLTASRSRSGSWAITWRHSLLLSPCIWRILLSVCVSLPLCLHNLVLRTFCLNCLRVLREPSWCTTRTVPGPDEWFSIRSTLCHLGHLGR